MAPGRAGKGILVQSSWFVPWDFVCGELKENTFRKFQTDKDTNGFFIFFNFCFLSSSEDIFFIVLRKKGREGRGKEGRKRNTDV